MRRIGLFAVVLTSSVAALLLVVAWYVSSYQSGYGSVAGMMGQMMGNANLQGIAAPMPAYIWTSIIALFAFIAVGVAGLAYYLAYPEIKTPAAQQTTATAGESLPADSKENWETVLRTSKPEERKVLEVLAAHDGTYLQKFIVKESGLSRLKTHRIISRFGERGIIVMSRSGNTNEVSLAPWLRQDASLAPYKR